MNTLSPLYVTGQCIFIVWFFFFVGIQLWTLNKINRNPLAPLLCAVLGLIDLWLLLYVIIPGQVRP